MDQKTTIDFVDNATTREALRYIHRFTLVIMRNLFKAIDDAAHRWPWALIGAVLVVCTITSYVCIGQARAERDYYNKENYQLTQELSKYKAAVEEVGVRKP
jgi:hypothetical protein